MKHILTAAFILAATSQAMAGAQIGGGSGGNPKESAGRSSWGGIGGISLQGGTVGGVGPNVQGGSVGGGGGGAISLNGGTIGGTGTAQLCLDGGSMGGGGLGIAEPVLILLTGGGIGGIPPACAAE